MMLATLYIYAHSRASTPHPPPDLRRGDHTPPPDMLRDAWTLNHRIKRQPMTFRVISALHYLAGAHAALLSEWEAWEEEEDESALEVVADAIAAFRRGALLVQHPAARAYTRPNLSST